MLSTELENAQNQLDVRRKEDHDHADSRQVNKYQKLFSDRIRLKIMKHE